jgi:hypothetical protein
VVVLHDDKSHLGHDEGLYRDVLDWLVHQLVLPGELQTWK